MPAVCSLCLARNRAENAYCTTCSEEIFYVLFNLKYNKYGMVSQDSLDWASSLVISVYYIIRYEVTLKYVLICWQIAAMMYAATIAAERDCNLLDQQIAGQKLLCQHGVNSQPCISHSTEQVKVSTSISLESIFELCNTSLVNRGMCVHASG